MPRAESGDVTTIPHRIARGSASAHRVKRAFDITACLALATVTLPIVIAIAAAIRLDSPGPVLYKARRVGRHGRHFRMLKFRTMVDGAELLLQDCAHLNVATGMVKIPDDPRVTRTGRWLRRFSLDELPQVYNVLAGHMSLVGPRPHDVDELPQSVFDQDRRLAMRPGLTGLWQVSARSNPSLDHRIHYDTKYVNGWSLAMDARILARTVPVIMRGTGGRVQIQNADRATGTGGGGLNFEANGGELTASPSQSAT
ncbi:MAG TPA: sugar transferase [Acidimicrobiales bacterium]|nr:sugar transferase [Acidimicrobiales bacterium]